MKSKTGIFVICIFVGVGIFAFSKAVSFFKENQSLIRKIDLSLRPQIERLQLEKEKMAKDLQVAKESISNLERERIQIRAELFDRGKELKQTKKDLDEKEEKLTKIDKQIKELAELNNKLQERFGTILAEYIKLKKVVSSVDSLKKEITKLKKKQKIISGKGRKTKRIKKRGWFGTLLSKDDYSGGNGGFLVKNGKSTFDPRVKITVTSVEEE